MRMIIPVDLRERLVARLTARHFAHALLMLVLKCAFTRRARKNIRFACFLKQRVLDALCRYYRVIVFAQLEARCKTASFARLASFFSFRRGNVLANET